MASNFVSEKQKAAILEVPTNKSSTEWTSYEITGRIISSNPAIPKILKIIFHANRKTGLRLKHTASINVITDFLVMNEKKT